VARGAALAALCALAGIASAKPAAKPRWEQLPALPAMPAPDASGDVPSGDARIHYASYGKGDVVVLLHGGFGNGDHMVFQLQALAPAHHVIVIDSRGQGRSTRGTHGLHYHQMAEDVIAVLDALKLDHAAVVGWSDGAIIGLDLAIHHGDRITKVFAFGANTNQSGMIKGGGHKPTLQAYMARATADTKRLSPAPKELDALAADLGEMWRHEPSYTDDELASIAIPVAVADGDHEEIIKRSHTESIAKRIPGAKLVIFTDASHFALWQVPDDFDRAMLDFLDGASK
jgi:pimeloyl-ACP methyl ester carboxylesterase